MKNKTLRLMWLKMRRLWFSSIARYHSIWTTNAWISFLRVYYRIYFTAVCFGALLWYLFVTGSFKKAIYYVQIGAEIEVYRAEMERDKSEQSLKESRKRLEKAKQRNARLDEIEAERSAIEETLMDRYNKSSEMCQALFAQRLSKVNDDMTLEEGHQMFLEAAAFLEK